MTHPTNRTRRTVLGATMAAAIGGLASVGGRAAAGELRVDADTLIEGNDWFTVAVDGVRAAEVEETTVSIDGIAFASVEAIPGTPLLLAVDAGSLLDHERIRRTDSVSVEVTVTVGGDRRTGTDESRVVTGR